MLRRNPFRLLLVILLCLMLATTGCGGPVITGSGDKEVAFDVDYTGVEPASEISFWSNHPGGSIDTERALINDFQKETGIRVNLVTAGANYEEVSQKFQAAQTSRSVGDVVVVSDVTWFPAYLNGSIIPLEPVLAARNVDTRGYRQALFDDYLYGGKHYAVPYSRSTPIFYYNKDHFRRAGLPDRPPATWAEAADFGRRLKDGGIKGPLFGFPPQDQYVGWTMSNLVWGFGGGWSDKWDFTVVAGSSTRAALEFARSGVTSGWATVTSGDPTTPFAAGAVSAVIASTGSLKDILKASTFDVGVGFLPGGPVEQIKVVPTGGAGLAIATKSAPEKQLAAAMFITFMTNVANTAKFSAATGYLPVQTGADMAAVYAKTPQFKTAVDQLALKARSQDYARVFLPGGDRAISRTIQEILTTGIDPADALNALRDDLQSLYQRNVESRLK
jgi:sn-glycerol 3-phosphate transport system substrate-binding protein